MRPSKMTDEEIRNNLADVPGWEMIDGKLHRSFKFENFSRAFGFMTSLALVAEAFDSRPDLFEQTLRVFSSLPLAHLQFSKDDSYWDAIESAGY